MKSVFPLVESYYGVEPDENSFEDIAMRAWNAINNKHTRLYRYIADTENGELELPCNVTAIESVHIPMNDAQMTSNKTVFNSIETLFVEGYIDAWKHMNDPYNQKGKLLKYKEGNNTLYFSEDYRDVIVIYHGIFADEEDGLPMINEKEQAAITAFVAYTNILKEGIRKRDANLINLANSIKADWTRLCNAARIPDHLSQNDMNSILDVKHRWDRKQYGKSLKPMI